MQQSAAPVEVLALHAIRAVCCRRRCHTRMHVCLPIDAIRNLPPANRPSPSPLPTPVVVTPSGYSLETALSTRRRRLSATSHMLPQGQARSMRARALRNDRPRRAGAWKLAVTAFADAGFPCPQFKNPTDYFLGVASEAENIPELVDRQSNRWNASVRRSFVGADEGMGAVTIVDGDASIRSTGKSLHSLHTYGAARVSKNDLEAAHHEVCHPPFLFALLRWVCGPRFSNSTSGTCLPYARTLARHTARREVSATAHGR